MIFVKFERGPKGDATTDGFTDQINCDSMQFGVGRAISVGTGGVDRETSTPSFSEVTFSKSADIASTPLMAQASYGKSMGKGTVSLVNVHEGKPQLYCQLDLHDCIVSSYSASSGGDRPVDSFSLNFTKIVYMYQQFDGDKKVADTIDGYDLKSGKTFVDGKLGG